MISSIDTAGQYTVVVDIGINLSRFVMAEFAKTIMKFNFKIGQVSFIQNGLNCKPTAYMMGGELSINGTIASGYYLMKKRKKKSIAFNTSGLNKSVKTFSNCNGRVKLSIPKEILMGKNRNTITLSGIAYKFIRSSENKKLGNDELESMKKLCKLNPAGGIVYYQDNKITPFVKVAKTNTISKETACGSASLAFFILKNIKKIKQPSGKDILVDRKGDTFIIETVVKKVL